MNKFILLLSFFAVHGLTAQTVTGDWFYVPGDSFSSLQATNGDTAEIPSSGVDQIWDYSTLVGLAGGTNDLVDPSVMTQSDSFPNATVATGVPGVAEIYYANTGDTLLIDGIYQNIQGELFINYLPGQGELLATAPLSFSDTLNHTIRGGVQFAGMSADILAVQQLSYNGIGEVRLPTGDTIGGVAYLKTEVFSPDGLALANVHLLLKNSFANPLIQVTENFDPNTGATTRGVFWQSDFDTTTSTDLSLIHI